MTQETINGDYPAIITWSVVLRKQLFIKRVEARDFDFNKTFPFNVNPA